jgi:uncharacterized protein YaiL (DUF2058 family)
MSESLRDQLIRAGLVSEQQAKLASQKGRQPQQSRKKPAPVPEHVRAAQQAQAAKAAKDQQLNQRQQEKAERRARRAQVRQLVEQNRVPQAEGDDCYNFVDGGKIRRIGVNAQLRASLLKSELAIVRCDSQYELVPTAVAERIRERDPTAVVAAAPAAAGSVVDDAYKDFIVPDDLVW